MKNNQCNLVVLILLFSAAWLSADSFYSSVGLGLPQRQTTTFSAGMGGSGLGISRYLSLNTMNPAAMDLKGMSVVSAGMEMEIVSPTIRNQTTVTRQARPVGFFMALPLGRRPSLFFAFQPRTHSALIASHVRPYGDGSLHRTLDVKGGLSAASIGLQWSLHRRISLSAAFDAYFGAFRELWKTEFDDPSYLDTKENITTHFSGTGGRFGLYVEPINHLSFGLIYSPSATLQSRTLVTTGGGLSLDAVRQKSEYPQQFGIGLGVRFDKVTAAFDWLHEPWGNFKIDGKSGRLGDASRVAVGLEYLDSQDPLVSYGRRIAFRIGGSHSRLPFIDSLGEPVYETIFSFGFGLPFKKNNGRIDIACELGQRSGDSSFPYSENLTRITISATTVERWFIRRR